MLPDTPNTEVAVDVSGHHPIKLTNDQGESVQCGMDSSSFEDLAKRIRNASPETEKLAIVKRAVPANKLTSEQVHVVLLLLSTDNDRVDAASYVYNSVCDKNNFYVVYDAFTFDTAKSELDAKIQAITTQN